jgi:formylglycine-generating enzyme required for sulfatase activity
MNIDEHIRILDKTDMIVRILSGFVLIACIFKGTLCSAQTSETLQFRGLKVVSYTHQGVDHKLYDDSWAVVVGINQYLQWPDLNYAVNDALAVKNKLLRLGFLPENVTTLLNDQATKERIEQLLGDELLRKVGQNDRLFIYFAGHGQTEDLPGERKEGYIVPVDGDRENPFSTAVSMSSVRQFSERIAAKHVFYAIDACYSGMALMRSGGMDMRDQQYLQKVARFPARQLLTAGSAGEQVVEDGGHGIFTKNLLLALEGNADKFPPFGVLTGSELGSYLQPVVSMETDNRQTPQFGRLAGGEGEFIFVLEPEETERAPGEDQRVNPQPADPEASTKSESIIEKDYGFLIDRYEVTSDLFADFLNTQASRVQNIEDWVMVGPEASIERIEGRFVARGGLEDHPVTYVSWFGAVAFCEWQGAKLPTEGEWQQACQGMEGGLYPWGNSQPTGELANYSGMQDGYDGTAPVGSYPKGESPYGALDMSGNVWEWTATIQGYQRVVRGGAWVVVPSYLRCDLRDLQSPNHRSAFVGFRCVR